MVSAQRQLVPLPVGLEYGRAPLSRVKQDIAAYLVSSRRKKRKSQEGPSTLQHTRGHELPGVGLLADAKQRRIIRK